MLGPVLRKVHKWYHPRSGTVEALSHGDAHLRWSSLLTFSWPTKGWSLTARVEWEENTTSVYPDSQSCLFRCVLQTKSGREPKLPLLTVYLLQTSWGLAAVQLLLKEHVGAQWELREIGALGGSKNFLWKGLKKGGCHLTLLHIWWIIWLKPPCR